MNIISQKFSDVLKNKLEIKIKDIYSTFVDDLVDIFTNNLNNDNNNNKYLYLMDKANSVSLDIAKETFIEVIKEFDDSYRDSLERKRCYNINKKNVPRTITTILGDITFFRTYYETKNKDDYYFYIDRLLNLPEYDHYDPIVKGLTIRETFYNNQAQAGRIIGERITSVHNIASNDVLKFAIPRQSVNNWLNEWNVNINYDRNDNTPKILYIMADEKYIGCQDLDNDIMAKVFVVFEGVKDVGKGRRSLINRHIFTCYSNSPWEELLDRLIEIYDYDQIKEFYVLSDGGNWLTAGLHELKLESYQKVDHLLCLFHFKQAINHITTVKEERTDIFNSFINDKRKVFKNNLNKYIEKYPHKKSTIEKKIKYLLNHYKAAKHMFSSSIGSSMESHISHFIASTFASRPKGYSSNNIKKYFMLNDAKINGINLFNTYLQTYNIKDDNNNYNAELNHNIFNNHEYISTATIPYLNSNYSPIYETLNNLTKLDNEINVK